MAPPSLWGSQMKARELVAFVRATSCLYFFNRSSIEDTPITVALSTLTDKGKHTHTCSLIYPLLFSISMLSLTARQTFILSTVGKVKCLPVCLNNCQAPRILTSSFEANGSSVWQTFHVEQHISPLAPSYCSNNWRDDISWHSKRMPDVGWTHYSLKRGPCCCFAY